MGITLHSPARIPETDLSRTLAACIRVRRTVPGGVVPTDRLVRFASSASVRHLSSASPARGAKVTEATRLACDFMNRRCRELGVKPKQEVIGPFTRFMLAGRAESAIDIPAITLSKVFLWRATVPHIGAVLVHELSHGLAPIELVERSDGGLDLPQRGLCVSASNGAPTAGGWYNHFMEETASLTNARSFWRERGAIEQRVPVKVTLRDSRVSQTAAELRGLLGSVFGGNDNVYVPALEIHHAGKLIPMRYIVLAHGFDTLARELPGGYHDTLCRSQLQGLVTPAVDPLRDQFGQRFVDFLSSLEHPNKFTADLLLFVAFAHASEKNLGRRSTASREAILRFHEALRGQADAN